VSEKSESEPPRPYKWRYGPLRLVMPWLCIAVGVFMAGDGALSLAANGGGDPLIFMLGLGLIVVGIVTFFVARWQAKRGF